MGWPSELSDTTWGLPTPVWTSHWVQGAPQESGANLDEVTRKSEGRRAWEHSFFVLQSRTGEWWDASGSKPPLDSIVCLEDKFKIFFL